MAKVIVTGANGFLGSWLTRALIADGNEVYALVRKSSDLSELAGVSCQYLYGDVTNLDSLRKAFSGMDSVFHLAGLVAYRSSDREKMQRINVDGTGNVITACLENKVRRLVHLSSVVAVGAGKTSNEILNEESKFNLSDLNLGYFETKRQAEQLVIAAVKEKGLDAVMLNPSTIYGPGDAKKGSRKTQVKVAQGKFPFYTPGGVNVVGVDDVVKGILSAWKKGKTGERYILCGENITIKRLFEIIAEKAGVKAPTTKLPKSVLFVLGAFGDLLTTLGKSTSLSTEQAHTTTMFHWFDSSKAQRELDFHPQPAEIAIAKSVQWMRENKLLSGK